VSRTLASLSLLVLAACGGAPASPASSPPPSPPVPASAVAVVAPPAVAPASSAPRLAFRVTYEGGTDAPAVEGRLLVSMTSMEGAKNPFDLGWDHMRDQWLAAALVGPVTRGQSVEVDPDALAWPSPFSKAPTGKYRIAARLVRAGGADTLTGPVAEQTIDPAHAGVVELRLASAMEHAKPPEDSEGVSLVHFESRLLSAFYGRSITIDAIVILPAGYGSEPRRKYPTEYFVTGFGGTFDRYARGAAASRKARIDAGYPPLVRVILPGMIPTGHHVFADSLNDGPWGHALVEELIPELERRFALRAEPRARLLAGHSSGGWSSLWLQITHPDFFGGTWSTAPDPVDFRSFVTVDVTPGSKDDFFRNKDGSPRMLVRDHGKDVAPMEDFARYEDVSGDVSVLGTFNWVFSPRGPRGEPLPLFDRATGEQDPAVQRAWEKWDIRKVLDAGWPKLGPKLKGKLHAFAGGADTFHLNESLAFLCDFLKAKWNKPGDATCELVPDKTHFDLLGDVKDPKSLVWRIEHEMAAAAGAK